MGDHLRNLALLLVVGVAWGVAGPVQLSDDDVNPSALEMADSLLDFRCAHLLALACCTERWCCHVLRSCTHRLPISLASGVTTLHYRPAVYMHDRALSA